MKHFAVVYNGGNTESRYVGSLSDYKVGEFSADPILMSQDEANELLNELDNYVRNEEYIGKTDEDNEQAHWAYEKHEWGFYVENLGLEDDEEDEYVDIKTYHCKIVDGEGYETGPFYTREDAEEHIALLKEGDKEDGVSNTYEVIDLTIGEETRYRLGDMIKYYRFHAGLTQTQLAEKCGMAQPNIARIEAGTYATSIDVLSRIAEALGKRIELV